MGPGGRKALAVAAFPLFIAALIALAAFFGRDLTALMADRGRFREWIAGLGGRAVPAYIGLQFLQVVVFIIPGELAQLAGGFAFGTLMGSLWSLVGITLGSAFNFYAARLLGKPFAVAVAGRANMERIGKAASSPRAGTAFFLFFLIPGIPKDVLCYAAGLSPLGFPAFLLISMAARLPGIVGSSLMGDAAADGRWMLLVAVGGMASALFCLGLLLREGIHGWIERLASRDR